MPVLEHTAPAYPGNIDLHRWRAPALALLVIALVMLAPGEPPPLARITLGIFGLALVGWLATRLEDIHVALSAVVALLATGATSPARLGTALGHPLIWLLLAAFVLGAALRETTLATRLAAMAAGRSRSMAGLCRRLTGVIVITALLVPSTSGRAALLLPVFLSLSAGLTARQRRVLALVLPCVVLLSACASLFGAGAHLLAVELLRQAGHDTLDFLHWLVLGLPLAVAGSFLATETILRLFLEPHERHAPLSLDLSPPATRGDGEKSVLLALGLAAGGWLSSPLHGLDPVAIALGAALLVTLPGMGPLSLKAALKRVEWPLLLFLAAMLVLGEALLGSGATDWLLAGVSGHLQGLAPLTAALALLGLALLAHLLIGSRTARASLLVPITLVVAPAVGLAPEAAVFLVAVASGYCLSLPVSAKPLALYAALDTPTYGPADLARLSLRLLPLYGLLLVVFSLLVWPWLGLALR